MTKPRIVGIGGTPRHGSTTEQALTMALAAAEEVGAETRIFGGRYLAELPLYLTGERGEAGAELVDAIRVADGLILASPGYHGTISGVVKNAVDYIEETAKDTCLPRGTAGGIDRHRLRLASDRRHAGDDAFNRPRPARLADPLGVAINTLGNSLQDGVCTDEAAAAQLRPVGRQVTKFACLNVGDSAVIETV